MSCNRRVVVCFAQMRYLSRLRLAITLLGMVLASSLLSAQWIKHPTAGVPRKADGTVNMSAPTPRLADGKPDLSGIWMTGEANRPTGNLSSPAEQAAAAACHHGGPLRGAELAAFLAAARAEPRGVGILDA